MPTNEPDAGGNSPAAVSPTTAPPSPRSILVRRLLIISAVIVGVGLMLFFGIPWVYAAFTEESTDDAYVNGYPTFVAPRVSGQVIKVEVKDNNRVKKGQPIVYLDPEPYQIQVDLKAAYLDQAKADLAAAEDGVRAQIGLTRSNRYKLENAIENVNMRIEQLRANVADLEAAKARQDRARSDYIRAKNLLKTQGAISAQDVDLKRQDLRVTNSQIKQAREIAYQTRAGLGLAVQPEMPKLEKKDPPKDEKPDPSPRKADDSENDPDLAPVDAGTDQYLTQVPPGLDQNFSVVRQTMAELLQSAAPLGIKPSSYNLTPQQLVDEFKSRDPQGNVDNIYKEIMKTAPAVKQYQAKLKEAEEDLRQAKLNLSYCTVYAAVDGLITRRNVNPGNNLQAGQQIMAIRPIKEIWIDANFKETQLRNLRIGQYVRLEVDTYGSHYTYHGHITGFAMGTGSTLSLLPPENATGNFVKVVQRLPVRIELDDYDPDRGDPVLFLGLSVEPHVYLNRPATGPDAGKVLQPPLTPTEPQKQSPPADKPKGGKL